MVLSLYTQERDRLSLRIASFPRTGRVFEQLDGSDHTKGVIGLDQVKAVADGSLVVLDRLVRRARR